MKKKAKSISLAQGCAILIIVYIVLSIGLYFIAGEQFKSKHSENSIESVEAVKPIGEILKDDTVEQTFYMDEDILSNFTLKLATYERQNTGAVLVELIDASDKRVLFSKTVDIATLADNSFITLRPESYISGLKGKTLCISVSSQTGTPGNAVTLWYNDTVQQADRYSQLTLNGEPISGSLCYSVEKRVKLLFGQYYFVIMGLIGILLFAYCARLIHCSKTGKKSLGLNVINAFSRYNFLLKQLVSRDFKTKYKRSVLGVLWSFLNPLLTMSIQYLVFSTLFKSDIPNFAVYLMVGIVFFSFFNEATNMGLMSIVGNASLITKVYIPKYIFPVSRVMSSSINLFISMVPLLLMAIITRAPITPALLILPFSIICTIVFCIGMAFILSSAMVYFRDMQFLWSVLSMLWMYATPIFYPESILPQSLMFLFKMNPMYHFIRFSRTIILDGISPEPQAYLFCLIAAIVPFLLGTAIFKKAQDRFVLNI
jgi:ABC-2 type transport system permease protein